MSMTMLMMPTTKRIVLVISVKTPSGPISSVGTPSGLAVSAPSCAGLPAAMTRPAQRVATALAPVITCPILLKIFFINDIFSQLNSCE